MSISPNLSLAIGEDVPHPLRTAQQSGTSTHPVDAVATTSQVFQKLWVCQRPRSQGSKEEIPSEPSSLSSGSPRDFHFFPEPWFHWIRRFLTSKSKWASRGLQGPPGASRGLQGPPGASRGLQGPPGASRLYLFLVARAGGQMLCKGEAVSVREMIPATSAALQ